MDAEREGGMVEALRCIAPLSLSPWYGGIPKEIPVYWLRLAMILCVFSFGSLVWTETRAWSGEFIACLCETVTCFAN